MCVSVYEIILFNLTFLVSLYQCDTVLLEYQNMTCYLKLNLPIFILFQNILGSYLPSEFSHDF